MNRGLASPMSSDISPEEFARFQRFLNEHSGILLSDNKQYLVKNRLSGLLKALQLASVGELMRLLETGANPKVRQQVVDAMTTNETFWFRDPKHYDVLLTKLLPELEASKMGSPRIWSAACSSGQEPYSMSLLIQQAIKKGQLRKEAEIIGTDISHGMLESANQGIYSEIELSRGISPELKRMYFQSVRDGWQLHADVRRRVKFRHFNLLDGFHMLGKFDVIFCRNVLIYFSDTLKVDILERMADALNPGGYLFLSSTEALPAAVKQYEKVMELSTRFYRRI